MIQQVPCCIEEWKFRHNNITRVSSWFVVLKMAVSVTFLSYQKNDAEYNNTQHGDFHTRKGCWAQKHPHWMPSCLKGHHAWKHHVGCFHAQPVWKGGAFNTVRRFLPCQKKGIQCGKEETSLVSSLPLHQQSCPTVVRWWGEGEPGRGLPSSLPARATVFLL